MLEKILTFRREFHRLIIMSGNPRAKDENLGLKAFHVRNKDSKGVVNVKMNCVSVAVLIGVKKFVGEQ